MNPVTAKALEACRIGMSPSEATAYAVMGQRIAPAAVTRIESLCAADLARRNRERASRRRGGLVAIDGGRK